MYQTEVNLIMQNKKNVVYRIKRAVYHSGLWCGQDGDSLHWMASMAGVCFGITIVTQIVGVVRTKDDSVKLFESFSILSFIAMGYLKLKSLRSNHQSWKYILSRIEDLEDRQLNRENATRSVLESGTDYNEGERFADHIARYTKSNKRTLNFVVVIYYFTLVIFIVSPFTECLFLQLMGVTHVQYPHILPGWAPLDDIHVCGYIINILVEVVSAVYTVHVHISFDSITVGVMTFICGQFDLLRDYSEHIGGTGGVCSLYGERDDRGHYVITKCHNTHTLLSHIITELDKLLRNILGVYFLVASFTLCSVAVQLKTADLSWMQLFKLLQYICATLTQLFLYCYYGDAVYQTSLIVQGQGPFGGGWWNLSPRIRRELMTLGACMFNAKKLRAGPFNMLDLPNFIQIVRAAYSYYAVISQKSKGRDE